MNVKTNNDNEKKENLLQEMVKYIAEDKDFLVVRIVYNRSENEERIKQPVKSLNQWQRSSLRICLLVSQRLVNRWENRCNSTSPTMNWLAPEVYESRIFILFVQLSCVVPVGNIKFAISAVLS